MDMVTLRSWVYPSELEPGADAYVPDDAVGRHHNPNITPSPKQSGVYTPENLVENYTSIVWKEGFRSAGDFELKTHDVQNVLNLLPRGTLVSLRDSNEVCIVTTHHIDTDEDNQDVLTVTGRSVLLYTLDNRISWAYISNEQPDEDPNAVTTVNLIFQIPDHLAFVMWGGLVFPHSEGGYPNTKKRFELPYNISVPHTAISLSVFENGDYYRTKWPAPQETRLETVSSLLDLDQKFGVRTIRPHNASAMIYTPNLSSLRGEGILTEVEEVDKLLFDVYQGVDRTKDDENRVIFRYDSGDIDSAEYLSSIDGHKNFVNSYAEKNLEGGSAHIQPAYRSEIFWEKDKWIDITHEPYHFSTDRWFGPMPRSTWQTLHTHTIKGSGPANIRSDWLFNMTGLYMARHLRAIRIRLNGRQIGYWDHGGERVMAQVWRSEGSITNQELVEGDQLTLEAYGSSSNGDLRTLSRYSLQVNPAPHEDGFLSTRNASRFVHGLDFRLGAVESDANLKDDGLTNENHSRIRSDGQKYLNEHKDIEIITADISPNTPHRYNEDYGLGDLVWVQGKYGELQKMVVSEFTRTEEATGETGYPTLVRWEEPID